MSDVRLNDKSVASDAAYIYAETASGEQVRISKADLAAVVAELSVGIIKKGVFGGDLDTLEEEGLYRMRDSISNAPEGGFYDAPIFVFRSLSVLTQVVFLPAKNSISMRSKINSFWSSWKEL